MSQELNCPVVQVRFYEDRAEVTRRCRIELPPGPRQLRVNDLAPALVDSSLRLHLPNPHRVSGLRVQRAGQKPGDLFQQRHQLELSRRRGESLSRLCKRSEQGLEHWMQSDVLNHGGGDSWNRGLQEQLDGHLELLAQAHHQECSNLQLQTDLQAAEEQQRMGERQLTARLDFQIDGPGGELELEISYHCGCALWRPEYAAEVRQGKLHLAVYGVVWQNTGEDWTEARCLLASARPSRLDQAPPAEPHHLTLLSRDPHARERVEAHAATQSTRLAHQQEHVLHLAPNDRGRSLLWEAPRSLTMSSTGRPTRLLLAETELDCRLDRSAYPECSRDVFLRVQSTHDGFGRNWPLLAGPVRIQGSVQSLLPFCAPGQSFEFSLGRDEELNLWRETSEESDVVPITGTQRWTHEVKVWLQNLVDRPQQVWVRERIPVSELRHLKVELLESGGIPADSHGFVDRTVELGPYETTSIFLSYRILAAADIQIGEGPEPRAHNPLRPAQRVAVLLMSLAPEVSAQLFKELGPEQVQAITLEISKLPPIPAELRRDVAEDCCLALGITIVRDPQTSLEDHARHNPTQLADYLRRTLARSAA